MKPMGEEHLAVLRRHMVELIAILVDLSSEELGKAALDERVMAAMRRVPRHLFVPAEVAPRAYRDMPLPIGFDKTISQPFIVALMTDLLAPQPQEAGVEIIEEFARHAEDLLKALGSSNVGIRVGDGSLGWPEHAPFDKILVTAAATRTPPAFLEQLKPNGRLVMPVGDEAQVLTVIDKDPSRAIQGSETHSGSLQPARNGLMRRAGKPSVSPQGRVPVGRRP